MCADLFSRSDSTIAITGVPSSGRNTVVRGSAKCGAEMGAQAVIIDKNNEIAGCDPAMIDRACDGCRRVMVGNCRGSNSIETDKAITNEAPDVRSRSDNSKMEGIKTTPP